MDQRPVLVLDFGAQYAQLIARRVREVGRFSEIVPGSASAGEISAAVSAAAVALYHVFMSCRVDFAITMLSDAAAAAALFFMKAGQH